MPVPIDQLVQEFLINGYVVFEDFIPSGKAEALHAELMPMLEKVRARNSRVLSGDLDSGRGRVTEPLRYKIETPWRMPFSDPALYERAMPTATSASVTSKPEIRSQALDQRADRAEAVDISLCTATWSPA